MSSGNILLNETGKRLGNHILSNDKPQILVKQKFYQKPSPNIENVKETRPCSTPTEQDLLIRKKSRTAYFIFQDEKRAEMKAQVSIYQDRKIKKSPFSNGDTPVYFTTDRNF